MPAIQHDIYLWTAGGSRDVVFDTATSFIEAFTGVATVADVVTVGPPTAIWISQATAPRTRTCPRRRGGCR